MAPDVAQRSWISGEAKWRICHSLAPELAQRSWINGEVKWRIYHSMAPDMAQRSWISGERNHGGYVIPWLQRWHRGAGLMGK